jgi:hypothetical protein
MTTPRKPRRSGRSSATSSVDSSASSRKPTLGDKIHELARRWPRAVLALDLLVDDLLRKVRHGEAPPP